MKHPLVNRTSPKGQPFLGTCATCGKTNIPLDKVSTEECEKPGMTYEQAILAAITPERGKLLIMMLLCMALLLTVTVQAFAADLTPEEKTEMLKQAYRINGGRMGGPLVDLTLVPPPEAELPLIYPEPPVKVTAVVPKAALRVDVCRRHNMRKVVTGRSWRCRK
jgi:hypothetical protein